MIYRHRHLLWIRQRYSSAEFFFIFDFKEHLILIRTERESSWYLPTNALNAGIISGKQIEILYRATKDAIIKLMEGSQIWFRLRKNQLKCPLMETLPDCLLGHAALVPIPSNHRVSPSLLSNSVQNAPWAYLPSLCCYRWSMFNVAMTIGTGLKARMMSLIKMRKKWPGIHQLLVCPVVLLFTFGHAH